MFFFFFYYIIIPLELTNAALLRVLIFTSKLPGAACRLVIRALFTCSRLIRAQTDLAWQQPSACALFTAFKLPDGHCCDAESPPNTRLIAITLRSIREEESVERRHYVSILIAFSVS